QAQRAEERRQSAGGSSQGGDRGAQEDRETPRGTAAESVTAVDVITGSRAAPVAESRSSRGAGGLVNSDSTVKTASAAQMRPKLTAHPVVNGARSQSTASSS